MATYYESVLVLTVSKELSGTYNVFNTVAQKYNENKLKIRIIDTKQNSGAEGLLVQKCAKLIEEGMTVNQIVETMAHMITNSKILVQVKTLDNMIKSGRLSGRAGRIGRLIGMKPIVTLEEGKGALESVAFSLGGSNKKILKHLRKVLVEHKIMAYCIVHVNDVEATTQLLRSAQQIIGFPPDYVEEASSIIAIGAGQSAVALSYILEEEVN